MCGIVGYVGPKNAVPVLLDGLARLEYRGYDSAGVAVLNGHGLETRKLAGRVQGLRDLLGRSPVLGSCGIGHPRSSSRAVARPCCWGSATASSWSPRTRAQYWRTPAPSST